jgi:hypothetical protein
MSAISFALLQANDSGVSVSVLASRLRLPESWVEERIEAARLCLLLAESSETSGNRYTGLLAQSMQPAGGWKS